jgi:hypothetical protein
MKTFSRVCGVNCFPNTESCNGYCKGEAAAPPTYEVEEAKYEEKFIVLNIKDVAQLSKKSQNKFQDAMLEICEIRGLRGAKPIANYYVCNQDEPYAQKVIDIILEGETQKNALKV